MEKLMEMLNENGYVASIIDVNKATTSMKGLSVSKGGNVGKIYYDVDENDYDYIVNDLENGEWMTENEARELFENLDNLILCVRPKRNDEIITRDFLDLELYVRVDAPRASATITKDNIRVLGISEDELFEIAEANSRNMCVAKSMASMLGLPEIDDEFMMVAYTNGGAHGGSAIKFIPDLFDEDLYVIPSSVHEVICIPKDGINRDDINEMIRDINATQVLEKDRLSDHVYEYSAKEKEVRVAV